MTGAARKQKQRSAVMTSNEEFRRLKAEAGGHLPAEVIPRQPVVFGPEPEDLLGYSEHEPIEAVLHVA